MSRRQVAVWPPFVRAAVFLALSAGFGQGGALFAAVALGLPLGPWWPAAAQAHGHVQLAGWAGLLVLGVGLHFLPRLRGAPLARPDLAPAVLRLLLAGLVLRALAQPALAAVGGGLSALVLRAALVASGALELAGVAVALGLLVLTARRGPSPAAREGFRAVLPFLATAFAGLGLALGLNLAGLLAAARAGQPVIPARLDRPAVLLALHGFLVPVAVAMSARLFPLYFRTPLPQPRVLRAGLGCALAGLALRLAGESLDAPLVAAVGRLAQALALILFILGLGVFASRRPLPRQPPPGLADPLHLHALAAYAWLLLAAGHLAWGGAAGLGGASGPPDVEVHLLGAGFVTLLILGVGAQLLPGFARRPLRRPALLWATLALGNAAALLRVAPPFLAPTLPPGATSAALALAGLAGLLAVALFAHNLRLFDG